MSGVNYFDDGLKDDVEVSLQAIFEGIESGLSVAVQADVDRRMMEVALTLDDLFHKVCRT